LKRFIVLSISLMLLLILIPGCFTIQVPPSAITPPSGVPSVIGTFSSNPSTINAGGTSTLMWNVTGANSVSIDHGIGTVNAAGIMTITPASSTVYTISATNSAGTVTKTAMTTVNPSSPAVGTPVIIAFINNPTTINSDGTSTLLWNVTGADVVSIDQGIGQVNVAGTRIISPNTSTVYTISATNSAGTVTRSVSAIVNPSLVPFAVTGVIANTEPSTFTGPCPKTFTFYSTITVNGPGTVTYRWERNDGAYSNTQSITFDAAGAKTATMQWDLGGTASGWHRVHVLTPYDAASNPVYYTLNCAGVGGSLVTGIVVGVDQYPFTGPCPKTIHFWGTITASGPGAVTYRWERSDGTGATSTAPETIIFTAAGSQTVTNLWTRGEGTGWQRLHVLTPDNAVSSQVDFVMTCWNQAP
jgi:hypothetical protein